MKSKEEVIGAVKKTAAYKLIKTSEAVLVIGGLAAGVLLGAFDLVPAVVLLAAYSVLNLVGLSNEPLYVIRDKVEDKVDEVKDRL